MSRLTELVRGSKALLLDFDGPVCDVFAGHPAPVVARQVAGFLVEQGVELSPQFDDPRDPLKLLVWVGTNAPEYTRAVEDLVIAGEVTAAETSSPTPHTPQVIATVRHTGRPVAVVSNNAEAAIARYLGLHDLADLIALVVGRAYGSPDQMKPDPSPVLRATSGLGIAPEDCFLVGDSLADILACQAAGVPAIGYAKTEARGHDLAEAGAELVIDTMAELLAAVDAP